jgi:putative GTP pyrophosphokinase
MSESLQSDEFDLEAHGAAAAAQFRVVRGAYEQLAEVAKRILTETLEVSGIRISSIEARAKSIASFERKASKPSETDPSQPRYPEPLKQITDLAGVRVIAFLPRLWTESAR